MLCNKDTKCKNDGNLVSKEVKNLDKHDCPKTRELVDPKADQ